MATAPQIIKYLFFYCSLLAVWSGEFEVTGSFSKAPSSLSTSEFSDDEQADMGDMAGSIVAASVNSTSPAEAPKETNHMAALMESLESIPEPAMTKTHNQLHRYDPPVENEDSCERDYKVTCPEAFEEIGDIYNDGSNLCGAAENYDGPCTGQTINVKNMSVTTKKHWSAQCLTNWPCNICERNFTDLCPSTNDFCQYQHGKKSVPHVLDQATEIKNSSHADLSKYSKFHSVCTATHEYTGPCKGYDMDFSGFNIIMKQKWSSTCHAWWPCSSSSDDAVIGGPDADYPITMKATRWRLRKGYQ